MRAEKPTGAQAEKPPKKYWQPVPRGHWAERIWKLVVATGWTKIETAKKLGMSTTGVDGVLSGTRVSAETARRIIALEGAYEGEIEASAKGWTFRRPHGGLLDFRLKPVANRGLGEAAPEPAPRRYIGIKVPPRKWVRKPVVDSEEMAEVGAAVPAGGETFDSGDARVADASAPGDRLHGSPHPGSGSGRPSVYGPGSDGVSLLGAPLCAGWGRPCGHGKAWHQLRETRGAGGRVIEVERCVFEGCLCMKFKEPNGK